MAEKLDLIKDSTMTISARIFADAIRRTAPYQAIARTVRIGKRQGTDTSRFITVLVGTPRFPGAKGAQFAAKAFDTGSGIHGKLGKTYTIAPLTAKKLVFFSRHLNSIVAMNSVQHPGVEGTGYIKEAASLSKGEIKKLIKESAGKNLRLYLNASFRDFDK